MSVIKVGEGSFSEGKYIYFRNFGQFRNKKTNTYEVSAKQDNLVLGVINWYARWRKYVFEPTPNTIYEEHCLRDIAEFCESETKKHKESLRFKSKSS